MDNTEIILRKLQKAHPNAGCELRFGTPFELLVAVILSAQCTDKRVNAVTEELFKAYDTPEAFAQLTVEDLKPYIYSCGFYNNKGANIISTSAAITERFGGEVPRTMEELLTLPGVGRKTASVVLTVAYGVPAMPVDTHVYRVARRLGLSDGNTPEKVERDLKNAYAESDRNALHHTLIFQGRYVCKAQRPNCGGCALTEECRYYKEKA